ncbi:MAG: hypothetical protein AAF399_26590 [Bacteroidota bacterium]
MNPFLEKFNEELDDLDISVSLGEEEYVEAFETQKAKFQEQMQKFANGVDELKLDEKAAPIRAKFEELMVQLSLGKAETKEAFEKQQSKLNELMHQAGDVVESAKADAGEKYEASSDAMKEQMEKFRTKLDLLRLHFHLGSADASDEMKEQRDELLTRFRDLKQKGKVKADEMGEEADEKWDEVKTELGEAYDHFKGALKRLFS